MQTAVSYLIVTFLALCASVEYCHAAATTLANHTDENSLVPKKAQDKGDIHWGYDGTYGPSNWSHVNENCGKRSQSPIDITTNQTILDDSLDEIFLTASDNQDSVRATNNGHSVNLVLSTTFRLSGGKLDNSYRVAGLHFHWGQNASTGSEHTVNGKAYPLEMHIVSYDEEHYDTIVDAMKAPKGLAVIGLFFEISPTPNPLLQQLVNQLSQVAKPGNSTAVPSFDVKKLLPMRLTDYYRYSGSLTTPACYESVIWTVLRNVSTVSQEQLDIFRNLQENAHGDIIHMMSKNWRPTQPLNGRTVYRSFFIRSLVEGQVPVKDTEDITNDDTGDDTMPSSATSMFSKGLFSSIGAVLIYIMYATIRAF